MIWTLITALFLTVFSQTVWASETPNMVNYSAIINDSLDRNGADCRLDTFSVKEKKDKQLFSQLNATALLI